jgi:hypothetical protein
MKIAARYIWEKVGEAYGWKPWTGSQFTIQRHDTTGYYGIYEENGRLLAECTDYRSARRVVGRIRQLELAPVTPFSLPQVGFLRPVKDGWEFFRMDHLEENGKQFATRAEAEVYIRAQPLQ